MTKTKYMFVTFVSKDGEAPSPLQGFPVLVTEEQQEAIVRSAELGARMCAYLHTVLDEKWPESFPMEDGRLAIVKIDDGPGYDTIAVQFEDLQTMYGRDILLDLTSVAIGAVSSISETRQ